MDVQVSAMAGRKRQERFGLRFTPEEREMLEELAQEAGLDASDVVRQLIRKEHALKRSKQKPKS